MGGTVAEELVFGQDQVSSGATDDLRQARERVSDDYGGAEGIVVRNRFVCERTTIHV